MALSNKQRAFIEEYLSCWNATEAYRRAYPAASTETARRNGHKLLTNTDIKKEIQQRISELAMTADEVLVRLSEQARAEYARYIMADGSINLSKLVADGKAHLVKSVKETRHGTQIEFVDAQAALIQLAKHHGLLVGRVEVTGADGGPLEMDMVERSARISSILDAMRRRMEASKDAENA